MRFSSATKAVFIMVNHVIASHYPPELLHPGTLFGRDKYASELHTRQNQGGNQGNNQVKFWDYREACNNCVENCPAGKIINPNDCSKCKDCPNGQKPDGEQKKCVEDKKSKKFNEVYKDKRQTYKENRGFERWKKSHQRTYDRARNREDRTKVRRMARCLALVPLAMGVAAVEEYSETFDEDWTDSMELLEFWPEGLEVDEWVDDSSDELFENDDLQVFPERDPHVTQDGSGTPRRFDEAMPNLPADCYLPVCSLDCRKSR